MSSGNTSSVNLHEVAAHQVLRSPLEPLARHLRQQGVVIHYFEDVSEALDQSGRTIVLPALSNLQLRLLSSTSMARPLGATIAVVTDASGQQTHAAFQSGATLVVNTLIPPAYSASAVQALLVTHKVASASSDRYPLRQQRPPQTPNISRSEPLLAGQGGDDFSDASLVASLHGPCTITDLARQFFCSERSMYRRARQVYKYFGVAGRYELRQLRTSQV